MSRSVGRSLRLNALWMLLGSLVYAACQWGMISTLTKISHAEVVGQFVLAFALVNPIILFAMLSLRTIQATDASMRYEFADYLGLRLAALALGFVAIAGIAIGLGYPRKVQCLIGLVALSKSFEGVSDTFCGLAQAHERIGVIAVSRTAQGVLQFLCFAVLVFTTQSLILGVAGLAAASGLVAACYDVPMGLRIIGGGGAALDWWLVMPRWSRGELASLFRLSFPLGISTAMLVLNSTIPRYYVKAYLGYKELGIFASLSQIMIVSTYFLMGALVQSAAPRLARLYHRDRGGYWRLLGKLAGIGAAGGVAAVFGAALWGRPLLSLLYSPEYGERPGVFVWLMVGATIVCVAWAFEGGVMAMRRFRGQLYLSITVAATTACACAWLIPRHGLVGAAWATNLGLLVQLVGNGLILVTGRTPHAAPEPSGEIEPRSMVP